MATVTKRSETWSRDESQRQVLHPLQRLRGYIRLYVSAEGLAVLLIYLALWFWIGLVLDYGFFKAWGIDWVQELPRVLRVIVLFLLSAGLLAVVTVKVLFRMCREFRDTALALVLERRFHALLGDRLITAVEMADPKLATRYGYSQGMIDQTIREAAENVDRVPVREVFNWKRLGHYAGLVALLTLGVYILTGVGYCVFQRTLAVSRFVPRFNDVAQIWVERNILLKDTLWPRRAYLVLMNFPGEEMRIGRDAPPPTLHVRAYKWVIADDNQQQAPEGWRPLRWDEVGPLLGTDAVPSLPTTWQLRHRPESMALLGGSPQSSFPGNLPWVGLGVISREEEAVTVDEVDGQLDKFKVRHRHDGEDLPANWVLADTDPQKAPNGWRPLLWDDLKAEFIGVPIPQPPADWKAPEDNAALSADQVEARLDQPEVRRSLPAPAMETYRNVFTQLGMLSAMRRDVLDELEKLADAPHMSRRLRKLVIPAQVRVVLKGSTMSTEETLQRHENNEYSGTLPDLKESVRFTVRGEDYATPYKKITVVPPPDLVELVLDEDEPAYLYQRPPRNGTLEDLRGLKQQFRGRVVSLAGEKSSIDVPAGTDVWLTARVDKDLRLGGIHVLPQKGSEDVQAPIAQDGKKTFKTWFTNVTKPIDLVFEFTDTDKVTSQRHVLIKPTPDQPPEVEVQVEVLRKTGQGYLCTPWAFIPFSGKVRDDRGLSEVQYTYTLAPVEALPNPAITKATLAADLLPPDPGGVLGRLTALLLFDRSGQLGGDEENLPEKQVRLSTFDHALQEQLLKAIPREQLLKLLTGPEPNVQEVNQRLLRELTLEPDFEYFDVGTLNLAVADDKKVQPHYRLRLGVTATDNNIETGPRVSQRKEKFTILIVSEEELLAEIGKEEENLRIKLQDAVDGLKDARTKLNSVAEELDGLKPEEFSPKVQRAIDLDETILKAWNSTREVQGDYRRILKELTINQGGQTRVGLVSKMITKVDDKICKPLGLANDQDFPEADESMRGFQKTLEGKTKNPQAIESARDKLTQAIDRLSGVLDNMADLETINNLIRKLTQIRDAEDAELQRLKDLQKKKEGEIFDK